jgi:predicted ATPase
MHLRKTRVRADTFPVDDSYPFCLDVLRAGPEIRFEAPITCFCGDNGTGKSTLLIAIARACGIHIWNSEGQRRLEPNPHEDRLHEHLEVEWARGRVPGSFFGSDIFKDFSRLLEEWAVGDPGQLEPFGGRSLLSLSHGQSLMSYFRARYAIPGIYFLDEPETALSPGSQLELVRIMASMAGAGHAQFIVASHSPFILSTPGAQIYSFDRPALGRIDFEESATYRLYKDFMADRSAFLPPP